MNCRAIIALPALLLFSVFACADEPVLPRFGAIDPAGAPPENGAAAPAGPGAEEPELIRDKLITSLFFRGELADGIIEAGIQDQFVSAAGLETYADLRQALLDWIRKNPDEAAEVYFRIKGRGPGVKKRTGVVTEEWWEFNPVFLRLIAAVNRAAGDGTLPREEVSLIASRLFAGREIEGEAGAPVIAGGRSGGPVPQGAGSASALDYADYKLDPAAAGREAKSLGGLLEGLKAALEEEGGAENRRLSESAFELYKRFLVAISGLKARRNMTAAESRELEALRRELKRKLAAITARCAGARLRARGAALPAGAPGADLLLKEAQALEAAFAAFAAGGGKDGGIRRLYELQKAADFWTFRFSAYRRLAGLKSRAEGVGFSCVLDRLVFELLARFAPSAGYARLKKELAVSAAAMAAGLEGVAAGDPARTAKFAGGTGDALSGKISEIERKIAAVEACSRINRRLQFLFWDAFLNPPGLEPARLGARAGNKLLQ